MPDWNDIFNERLQKKKPEILRKNINAEIRIYVVDHNSEILTEKLLRHWERENKSTEFRGKVELQKEVGWFKGLNSWKKSITTKSFIRKKTKTKQNQKKTMNIKWKTENPRKEQTKRKLNEKETSNDQLKMQQDQCSISDIESAPSDDTLIETVDAISNNNFHKYSDNSFIKNSSTTDQEPDHFYQKTCLIRGGWK